ncbi:MAG: GNAT family N-acetyltransferase [Planctomycetaceae bacterium]
MESIPGAACTPLPWDSQFWGFAVARLDAETLSSSALDQADAWCAAHGIRCLYVRVGGSDPRTLAAAEAGGCRFVDVRMELALPLTGRVPAAAEAGDVVVRAAGPADLPQLEALAAKAHRDTRFFKDSRFPAARAADLYRAWLERDVARHVAVVCETPTRPTRPCGYVTCELDAARGEGRIGLLAVAPESTGRGLGTRLVRAALQRFAAEGLRTARVATQATNVAALRLYEAAGFRTCAASLWFHKWFAGGAHE